MPPPFQCLSLFRLTISSGKLERKNDLVSLLFGGGGAEEGQTYSLRRLNCISREVRVVMSPSQAGKELNPHLLISNDSNAVS